MVYKTLKKCYTQNVLFLECSSKRLSKSISDRLPVITLQQINLVEKNQQKERVQPALSKSLAFWPCFKNRDNTKRFSLL